MSTNNGHGRTNTFDRFQGRLVVRGTLTALTPLRIATGSRGDQGTADITVVKDALGRPIIPGSSFKGVLRAYVESLLRAIDPALACLCVTTNPEPPAEDDGADGAAANASMSDPCVCPTTLSKHELQAMRDQLAGEMGLGGGYQSLQSAQRQQVDDEIYLKHTCRVCQVFGSDGLASKVHVPDMAVAGEWYGRYPIRQSVSIDRDTETAAAGRLFSSEVVPVGTTFACEIIVENGSDADQGLVLLGLRAFERELVALGGGVSRGLGRVGLAIDACQTVADSPTALLDFLVGGAMTDLDEAGRNGRIAALRAELGI